jgi:hypothetical protein
MWRSSLTALWFGDKEALGEVNIDEALEPYLSDEPIHPIVLDICTGMSAASLAAEPGVDQEMGLFLPLRYEHVVFWAPAPRHFFCRAKWRGGDMQSETQSLDLDFLNPDGTAFGEVRNFTVKRAPRQAWLRGLGADAARLLYRLVWQDVPAPTAGTFVDAKPGVWFVVGGGALLNGIRRDLQLHNNQVVEVDARSGIAEWNELFKTSSDQGDSVLGILWITGKNSNDTPDLLEQLRPDVTGLLQAVTHLSSFARPRLHAACGL